MSNITPNTDLPSDLMTDAASPPPLASGTALSADATAQQAVVVGGGPAGLMAAEALSRAGWQVDLYDAMPSLGRKFLLAGIGGMNITHSEDFAPFCARYADGQAALQASLDGFTPESLRGWARTLGIETFIGSSGRVFPQEMKAAPLLRAWLHRLRQAGVRFHVRHRWLGWDANGALRLQNTQGELTCRPQVTVLALGGASWPTLGSDGRWLPWLEARGVAVTPLQSANCGFHVAWSAHLQSKFAGTPLKSIVMHFTDAQGQEHQRQGEMIVTAAGVEGGLIYAMSRVLRNMVNLRGSATFTLDLAPGRDAARVLADVQHPRGTKSLSSHLHSRVGISGIKAALLYECVSRADMADPEKLAHAIKCLPITVGAPRDLSDAISTAGGVAFSGLNSELMLQALPGVFIAGEMLDWEAPTGGYLLTACLATGLRAGNGAAAWLKTRPGDVASTKTPIESATAAPTTSAISAKPDPSGCPKTP